MLGSRKKLNYQITTFPQKQQSFIIKSGRGEEEFKKEGLSKEQAHFEKEDVKKVGRWEVKEEEGQVKGFVVMIENL